MTSRSNKATLQLKDGVQAAVARLRDVVSRRSVEAVLIKLEADSNCSGYSVEEWDVVEEPIASGGAISIPVEDFQYLFDSIVKITTLQEIILDYYANPIPIKTLSSMFRRNGDRECHIERLNLRHVSLIGELSDFMDFTESISRQSTLRRLHMTSCKTPDSENSAPLVNAFSSVQSLREISIEEMKTTGDSLVNLCRLPNLCSLNLRHISACNTHMVPISRVLKQTRTLQHIQVRYALDRNASLAFFQMLQENSSLLSVDIDMDCWDDYGEALAGAISANQRLENLELNVYGIDDKVESNALALAVSMAENSSLKRLCLTFHSRLQQTAEEQGVLLGRIRTAFVNPFAKVIAKNYALGILEVGLLHRRVTWNDLVRFYLKLNQAGRRELVLRPNEASRAQWIETLIAYRDDLDVLYYFLSMNPSVTSPEDESMMLEPLQKRQKMEAPAETMG